MKPGNAGGGKGPQLKGNARSDEDRGIDDESSNPRKCSEVADGVARESELSALKLAQITRKIVAFTPSSRLKLHCRTESSQDS
jgi:hypothetical protein